MGDEECQVVPHRKRLSESCRSFICYLCSLQYSATKFKCDTLTLNLTQSDPPLFNFYSHDFNIRS